MTSITPPAVPFAQGQDAERLRIVVDRTATEVKDYTIQYEEQQIIVEALGSTQLAPENKSDIDILEPRERQLDAARIRETTLINNLTNCCISDNNVLHAQAATATTSIAPLTVGAIISTVPASPSEKKTMNRNLPEPRDGWKDSTGKLHRAHSDAIAYHKTMSTILWQPIDVVHQQSNAGADSSIPVIPFAKLVPLTTLENTIDSFIVLQLHEIGLNYVHEASHSVYLRHVYDIVVAETCLGGELFEAY